MDAVQGFQLFRQCGEADGEVLLQLHQPPQEGDARHPLLHSAPGGRAGQDSGHSGIVARHDRLFRHGRPLLAQKCQHLSRIFPALPRQKLCQEGQGFFQLRVQDAACDTQEEVWGILLAVCLNHESDVPEQGAHLPAEVRQGVLLCVQTAE